MERYFSKIVSKFEFIQIIFSYNYNFFKIKIEVINFFQVYFVYIKKSKKKFETSPYLLKI